MTPNELTRLDGARAMAKLRHKLLPGLIEAAARRDLHKVDIVACEHYGLLIVEDYDYGRPAMFLDVATLQILLTAHRSQVFDAILDRLSDAE